MAKKTVLIVDDEERNIKLLKAYLMTNQYEVVEASRGEEALKMVNDFNPDLILLDVMMPGIDGFEVCKRLKQDDKTQMIPVVMVTALREREDRIRALEAGADDFLSKPVDRTELLGRVKSLLRIKSYHDELLKSYKEIALKNEKLKELERIKEGLTHMIIHDLNNPLSAIYGNLEMIKVENQNLSETEIDTMDKCLAYSLDLRQMVQGLLDVHRMEEGKLQPVKELTNVTEMLADLMEQFIARAKMDHISLTFSNSREVPSVMVDPNLIKRVIANLLSNAIRHTPEGGGIEVTTDFLAEKNSIAFSVKDNGNGLEPEYHQRIFDKFEQVELKKSGASVGIGGLGLTFCKMAVEAHGGEIWVESDGNAKGCTFKFMIPA
ncbi:MAG: response regulator [Candidatus Aminicenantes bacterium]|nr:response regulator [Candidatus Aminicenantes bacterium]